MPSVKVKCFHLDPTDCVRREARRLGTVREEAVPWLAEEVARWFDHGNIGLQIRRNGTQLPPEELKALGLRGNVRMSREVMDALTEKGRADPLHLFDLTCKAISKCLWHQAQRLDLEEWQRRRIKIMVGVEFLLGPFPSCRRAQELAGQRFPLGQQPDQPLPECDAEICGCWYRLLSKREVEGR